MLFPIFEKMLILGINLDIISFLAKNDMKKAKEIIGEDGIFFTKNEVKKEKVACGFRRIPQAAFLCM